MTPERLAQMRVHVGAVQTREHLTITSKHLLRMMVDLFDYIDLLHEDLRITRQERDHAKHQALEHRKARAQAETERDAYRRGQGPAPTPATPGAVALHETHPIPNSRGDDQ